MGEPVTMTDDLGVARINIQGDWDLEMVSEVTHVYVQVYSAGCFMLDPSLTPPPADEAETGRYSYPWRGGYSAVNFFRSVYAQLPARYRPEVLEIAYASPGFIELLGYSAALSLVVRTVTVNATKILAVYKDIQDQIAKRELNKLDARQRHAHARFVEAAYNRLAEAIELPAQATEKLHAATQKDAWARLKIALALSRRIEKVAQFEQSQIVSLREALPVAEALRQTQSKEKIRKITAKVGSPLSVSVASNRNVRDDDDT
jgi:hypothetical protein